MPMSASAVVNRAQLLGLLDELDEALGSAFSDAQRVLRDREGAVEAGRREAEQIVADARNERDRLMSDTEVYRLAKREADELIANAHAEADGLRKETDDYVDAKLANFEVVLTKTLRAVERGRAKLRIVSGAADAEPDDDLEPLPD